ncbi:threonylcarbamoyl-AMP synthase [Pseudaminobacter manganicus]|uniref:Threonylcarbamoyl-AMP synthase n=1 Tax=Manganibacter manganicus TaxID=1873176 RepID=A0A1V8RP26_9HYPH|nr:threonylcarbamoyl-AMP synthase [Pseudaminobacter manganicus]
MAEIVPAGDAMERALALLGKGEVVAIPTETVYGLAGDATNGEAVARIFEAKGRPRFNPLIAHVSDLAMAERIGRFDPLSRKLADAFWPGPLTLVVPLQHDADIHPLASAGLDTIALRMPQGFGATLIARFGRPLSAPSANTSGRISPTSAAAVTASLGEKIRLVVDGGATEVGLESTIVRAVDGGLRLLRPGGMAADEIERVAGVALQRGVAGIQAPGMMVSHYAPNTGMRLDAKAVREGEALLAFGPKRIAGWQKAAAQLNLSEKGDLREAASNLFAFMRQLDVAGAEMIAVETVPMSGLGEAINDRLSRAAAPRGLSDDERRISHG